MSTARVVSCQQTLSHHTERINAVALSPDGSYLLSGGDDADVVIWYLDSSKIYQVISSPFNGPVASVVWIPSIPNIVPGFAFGCADGSIHFYQRVDSSPDYQYFAQECAHKGPVLDLKFDPHFGRIASAGDGYAQVWAIETGRTLRPMNPAPTASQLTAISVQFWEDGASALVCTLENHTVECYSIQPWSLKWSKQIRTRIAHSALKDNYLAVTNLHNGIDIYNLPTMQLVKSYSHGGMDTALYQVAFAHKDWVVSGSQDGHARIYDLTSGAFLQNLDHCEGKVLHAITSQTRSNTILIVTAASDIKVWHAEIEKQTGESTAPSAFAETRAAAWGMTMGQFVSLLLLSSLANFSISHFGTIASVYLQVLSIASSAATESFRATNLTSSN